MATPSSSCNPQWIPLIKGIQRRPWEGEREILINSKPVQLTMLWVLCSVNTVAGFWPNFGNHCFRDCLEATQCYCLALPYLMSKYTQEDRAMAIKGTSNFYSYSRQLKGIKFHRTGQKAPGHNSKWHSAPGVRCISCWKNWKQRAQSYQIQHMCLCAVVWESPEQSQLTCKEGNHQKWGELVKSKLKRKAKTVISLHNTWQLLKTTKIEA